MGKQLEDLYLEALGLLNLKDLARESGRGYRTLHGYRLGERGITEAAVREMLEYIRERSEELTAAANALEAALAWIPTPRYRPNVFDLASPLFQQAFDSRS